MLGGSRNVVNQKEAKKHLLKRISMATMGGAFLIQPMLVKVLHKSLLMALPTSSICVVIFSVILAFALDDLFNILSGTAAYPAALVVFFGTSGP
jgi:UDP-N-acetylmuramyl pentapeptide phosphotransferase/UDP-N-acetylglucosamine-1-phosphate transferase